MENLEQVSKRNHHKREEENKRLRLYIQMEYCSGKSLKNQYFGGLRKLNSKEIFNMFNQILNGLNYIHQCNLVHRDLKLENILINRKGILKISDFGLATIINKYSHEQKQRLNKTSRNIVNRLSKFKESELSFEIGTPLYFAPELQSSKYDKKVDVYSLGIILFELVSKFDTQHERYKKITSLRKKNKVEPSFMEQNKI